ncbi:MAG: Crp/Fnr family transcriptional regulator [Algoriphagus sp.]|nr:Crp/Fnr family transcriptional regulator [Algoriphagus sp.]
MSPSDILFRYVNSKAPITEQEFSRFKDLFHYQKVKTNEFILREGEVCIFNHFVLKGSFRFFHVNPEGQELTRYFAFENKFGTNLTSLIEGTPSHEYIQAVEPSEVLKIRSSDFFRLVETVPQINLVYRNILQNAYITSQKRIYDLQGMSALDRLKWLLNHQPGILSRIPSRMVASYLGITPYTLSRLKSEL